MSNLRESIDTYVKRVRELAEHVRGNEQATKQSLEVGGSFAFGRKLAGFDEHSSPARIGESSELPRAAYSSVRQSKMTSTADVE